MGESDSSRCKLSLGGRSRACVSERPAVPRDDGCLVLEPSPGQRRLVERLALGFNVGDFHLFAINLNIGKTSQRRGVAIEEAQEARRDFMEVLFRVVHEIACSTQHMAQASFVLQVL